MIFKNKMQFKNLKFYILYLTLTLHYTYSAGFEIKESSNVDKFCASKSKQQFRNTTAKELKISTFNSLLNPNKDLI